MLMKCDKCNKNIEVFDDAYFLYKRAIDHEPMYGGSWLRVHPLTCFCGGILHDISEH
jgi:hypothetical protein